MLGYFLGPSKILPGDLFQLFNLSGELFGKSICLAFCFHPVSILEGP